MTKKIVKCQTCGSLIEYDDSELIFGPIVYNLQQICIECPECYEFIPIGFCHI